MYYDSLKTRTLHAKHVKEMSRLTGIRKEVVYYFFREILEGIENEKFPTRPIVARKTLFTIEDASKKIFIHTHHKLCHTIKCFHCTEAEATEIMSLIRKAAELVDLDVVEDGKKYKKFTIYFHGFHAN